MSVKCNRTKLFRPYEIEGTGIEGMPRLECEKVMIWRYNADFSLKVRSLSDVFKYSGLSFTRSTAGQGKDVGR